MKPQAPGANNLKPPGAAAEDATNQQAKLLVRFIDVDDQSPPAGGKHLQIGKTYKYWIRVRMANPNFQSKDVTPPRRRMPPICPPPTLRCRGRSRSRVRCTITRWTRIPSWSVPAIAQRGQRRQLHVARGGPHSGPPLACCLETA